MSGTSMDGVDAALLWTDGERVVEPRGFAFRPYPPAFRAALADALLAPEERAPALEAALTDHHRDAVRGLLAQTGVGLSDVAVIGFHGHTVLHKPAAHRTWQLGDGRRLAKALGRPVVCDFRSADVAAGGEGAPLAPVYHRALAGGAPRPCAVLNLGGVANVTWIGPGAGELLAFDTGPANMLLDEWALRHTGEPLDRDGRLAAAGTVDAGVLAEMLAAPYFARTPPKSLDRLDFGLEAVAHLSAADGAATLVAFTAASVAAACRHMPAPPKLWIVGGGGRHNPALMQALRQRLAAPLDAAEAHGIDGDALEAEAFAYLAVRSVRGLPISFPGTTGAPEPLSGGRLFRPGRG
ncbi:MAG: anhydro-N-acetylmuramic acid kinase [Alphaproteobacteria bacterium]|nr:anhydro-N-acetylmuramic acid kinase [Alphaproteobacteria bacterium]